MPTAAIIGASADRTKFGNKSVRAHLSQGYEVFPVNPKGGVIEGLAVYKSLRDVPQRPLDRVSLYVPPAVGVSLLKEIAEVGCKELWLNPGSESDELVEKAEALGLNAIVACSIVSLGVSPEE
ncbi:MAG: CoA-binding protein [Planctomycetia bacterium]|nr:CoA-binding protein [Planctomycetia bacterium]